MVQGTRRFERYRPPDSLVAIARFPQMAEQRLQVKNISLDGLSFVTEKDLIAETFFNLSLQMADKDGFSASVDTPAKIVWFTFDEKTTLYTAGIQFLGLKETDKELLQKIFNTLRPEKSS